MKTVFLNYQVFQLEKEVGGFIKHIPKQNLILTDKNRFDIYTDTKYNVEVIKSMPFGRYDVYGGPQLEKSGLLNLKEWKTKEIANFISFYSPVMENILNQKYSAIIYNGASEGYVISQMINFMSKRLSSNNLSFKELFPMQCHVYIFTLEDRCENCNIYLIAYFSNQSDCETIKTKLQEYYREHYSSICRKSKLTADYLASTLIKNGINFKEMCDNGGNLLKRYTHKDNLEGSDLILIFSLLVIFLTIFSLNKNRRKLFCTQLKEIFANKKFVYLTLISLIIIIILMIFSFLNCDKFTAQHEGICCPDLNEDNLCDEPSLSSVKECLMDDVDNNLNKIAMGITCIEDKDCLLYAKKIGISGEHLDLKNFECGATAYSNLPELISCSTKQDCLNYIESQIDLSTVIRCSKNGFCQMTQLSMIGLQKIYEFKKI